MRHSSRRTALALSAGLSLLVSLSATAQSTGPLGGATTGDAMPAAELLRQVDEPVVESSEPAPFGANLFHGGFSNDREDGLNPDYQIQTGDRITVRIWGATEFNETLTVDPQGNIFLPMVGPVPVGGVRNRDVNSRVSQSVSSVFTDNVRVYTSLNGTQPVAVFVTGYVPNPGRFGGIPSNSPLHFLDRAGGVDNARGSYRDITVLRGGETLVSIDLYEFLLEGILPTLQFQDGDTIVVGKRGSHVAISGDVGNAASFELLGNSITGQELMESALLQSGVSYAGVSGVRRGEPFSTYVPLAEFEAFELLNGDAVHFRTDQHDQVIVVEVEGAHVGPSRFAVPRNTRLQELLDHIEVDAELADAAAVSIRRQSIANRQKAALEESLARLEARYLTSPSRTDTEAAIRTQEAKLISEFVQRARQVQPNGRLVVADGGDIANILLQAGDTITIPRRSDSILLSGEVLVSQALLYRKGRTARDYIQLAGGFSHQAMTDRIVLVHANGEVASGKNPTVRPGDELIVLPKVPVKNLQIASTIVDILYKVAIAASVAVQL